MWLDQVGHDVRVAWRGFARQPVAATVAVLSLAGGIGITTATLTIRNAVFFNPPPLYRNAVQLSRISISTPQQRRAPVPGALYAAWIEDAGLRDSLAAAAAPQPVDLRTAESMTPSRVRHVTAGLFSLLGVDAAIGRTFAPDGPSGAASQANAVVLSHQVWQNVFAGRTDVAGSTVWLDGKPHEIIGVMPERFWFRAMLPEIWTLLPNETLPGTELDVIARRPDSVSADSFAERLQRGANTFAASLPESARRIRVLVSGVRGTPIGEEVALIVPALVGTAVLLILLISCANVAILMFARWTAREHEIAIRSSLGASRARLVSLLLTESALIAAVGGALGVWATFALRDFILRNGTEARAFDMTIDTRILLEAALVTMLTGILSGLGPAVYGTRQLLTNPLRILAASERARQRWRHALVVLEISVTVALLVIAATQVDASGRWLTDDLGFNPASLLTARIESPDGVDTPAMLDVVRGTPGVAGVAAGTDIPFAVSPVRQRVAIAADGSGEVPALRSSITPEFFSVLDVPLRAGRMFTASELTETSRVVVVNEPLAQQLWPGGDAVGAQLWVDNVPYAVIGIAAGYRRFPLSPPFFGFYVPFTRASADPRRLQLLIRAATDPRPLADTIRRQINEGGAGGNATVTSISTFHEIMQVGEREILALTFAMSPLMGMALFLTATGIFGVLAFAVSRRAKELAVRVAIGAAPGDLLRLIAAHSLSLTLAGAVLGVGVTFSLTRVVRAVGGAGSAYDTPSWPAFAVPVAIVAAVVALASWLPVRRALRINPALLLRTD
jgi:putative ABC transport system permease protein